MKAVCLVSYKPEHKRYPEVVGVFRRAKDAAKTALQYMDRDSRSDRDAVWTCDFDEFVVTEDNILAWVPVPGDTERLEFECEGQLIVLEMMEVD